MQDAHDANKERGRKTKENIFLLIAQSEPEGMTTSQLVKAAGVHRDRIHSICKEYIDKKVLEKTGKFKKYHLGPNVVKDPGLTAFFFQNNMLNRSFFTLGKVALATSTEFCDAAHCVEIFRQKGQQLQKGEQSEQKVGAFDRLYLFEFALRLGSILSYQLIQSMRYTQQSSSVNDAIKTQLIYRWLQNTITPMFLIDSFHQLLSILENRSWKKKNSKPLLNKLELIQGRFHEMEHIFKETFPDIYDDLEKIRTGIPNQINAHKKRISELEMMDKKD